MFSRPAVAAAREGVSLSGRHKETAGEWDVGEVMVLFRRSLIGAAVLVAAGLLAVGSFSALATSDPAGDGANPVVAHTGLDSGGEAVCDTDGDGWGPDVVEFAGVVISISEFGLALRTDADVVIFRYTPDTTFEDAGGEPISKDQVVQGVSAFVWAVPSVGSDWFEALLVRLEGDTGTETNGDVDCDGSDGGDTDGDHDGGTDGDTDGDTDGGDTDGGEGDADGHSPGTGHTACSDATEDALARLEELQSDGRPVDRAVEAVTHCGEGAGNGDNSSHSGEGHAFGRDHGQGKPEGVPPNGSGE